MLGLKSIHVSGRGPCWPILWVLSDTRVNMYNNKPWKITTWSFMGCCNVEWYFSCNQAALRTLLPVRPYVCPSVCLSACYTFSQCFCDRIIMKFSGVITNDRSDVHAKGPGQRSKINVTEVKTQFSRFRTVTPVWIHIWWWNDAQSLMFRRGALLYFKVIHQISRSHRTKNRRFWPELIVSGL